MTSWNNTVSSEAATAATVEQTVLAANYVNMAASALIFYDASISFGQEVELVWKWKRSSVTFLFATNRIFGLMFAITLMLSPLNWSQLSSSIHDEIYFMVPEMVLFMVWALFSALRVYAIGGQAWRTASVVLLLALFPLGADLYYYSQYRFLEEDDLGRVCVTFVDIPITIKNIMELAARGSLIASDVIVLAVTWQRTSGIRRQANAMNMKMSLAALILRDGTVFFATALVLNVAQLVTFITLDADTAISSLATSVSCIITSRFFLSLRQYSWSESDTTSYGLMSAPLLIAAGTVSVMAGEVDISAMLHTYIEDICEETEGPELDMVELVEKEQPAIAGEAENVPI